jgi:hypothetical protein
MTTKNEFAKLYEKYNLIPKSDSKNKDIQYLIKNINQYNAEEKPDAYLEFENHVYAIEHFQISQYNRERKGDIAKIVKGSQNNREKMKVDQDLDYKPNLKNLFEALDINLTKHSNSFDEYKRNICISKSFSEEAYRLVIFVEDATESEYIVKKGSTDIINPLILQEMADIFLKYQEEIWGIIYSYGNEVTKIVTGYTLEELLIKKKQGKLLDSKDYVPFECNRKVHVSKSSEDEDTNTVYIMLQDGF